MNRLPPLRSLIALEAVIRTGNIVAAADELGVTAGAVSKQLSQLQQQIDAPLFEAGHRLRPTPLATELALGVGAGLLRIHDAWSAAGKAAETRVLTLAANATLAIHWILPRLVDAEAAMGGRPVRVSQLHTTDTWRHLPFDIAVIRQAEETDGWERHTVGVERLTLLAAPGRARRLRRAGLEAVADELFLVSKTRVGELDAWLAAAGLDGRPEQRMTAHFYIAVEAAVADQGCLIGPPAVLADLLAQKRLAIPFPQIHVDGALLTAVFDPHVCSRHTADRLLKFLFKDFGGSSAAPRS